MELIALVAEGQRRLRLGEALRGAAASLVLVAGTLMVASLARIPPELAAPAGILLALLVLAASVRRALRRWTPLATAVRIEACAGGLDNLLVTATALTAGTLQASDRMRAEVMRQAAGRTSDVPPAAAAPLRGAVALAFAALIGALAVTWSAITRPDVTAAEPTIERGSIQDVRATVTPPAYLGRPPQVINNPDQLVIPEGGRVRIEVSAEAPEAWLIEPGQPSRSLSVQTSGGFVTELTPSASSGVVIAVGRRAGEPGDTRIVSVVVAPDAAPRVQVTTPGRDLAVADRGQAVDIAVDASDAEALKGLRLAYVKMSGSGESFAFAEGEVPVAVDRASEREWHGRARISLASLKLEDGDSLVYRALARDSNPHASWVESEAYTIDVGKRLEFASAGAALPDEDRRYALSQQMVIVKTERLQGERARLATASWAERTRLLAMEQRMVRAEVVFLSGGEVEDEVAEAEQSSELQEGRLQNAGRAEMLRAINEMSRAEARLNAGDTAGALVFERSALAALQRAFDRRRYFLRTLGERSRIDLSRRLTGDPAKAQSSPRTEPHRPAPQTDLARRLMVELAAIDQSGEAPEAAVLGRLVSVGNGSDDWRQLAASLAAAVTPEARREAAERAMARLAAWARARAGASSPIAPLSELQGWWREESRSGERQ
jgi:hypothetical protein